MVATSNGPAIQGSVIGGKRPVAGPLGAAAPPLPAAVAVELVPAAAATVPAIPALPLLAAVVVLAAPAVFGELAPPVVFGELAPPLAATAGARVVVLGVCALLPALAMLGVGLAAPWMLALLLGWDTPGLSAEFAGVSLPQPNVVNSASQPSRQYVRIAERPFAAVLPIELSAMLGMKSFPNPAPNHRNNAIAAFRCSDLRSAKDPRDPIEKDT